MFSSDAKTIVVTGATRGLGRAMVRRFSALGHRVAGCGRSLRHIHRLREEVEDGWFAAIDVTDDRAVANFANDVCSRFGAPDLLLNNAALINRSAPLWEVSADEFAAVIDVNLKGVHTVIRHFLPAMIRRGRGVVVNFSSGWGRCSSPEVGPYCATKWGIEGMTAALAQELPRGLAAIALNPGVIDTDMLRMCFGETADGYPGPDAWADKAVPFLLDLSSRHNGQALTAP